MIWQNINNDLFYTVLHGEPHVSPDAENWTPSAYKLHEFMKAVDKPRFSIYRDDTSISLENK